MEKRTWSSAVVCICIAMLGGSFSAYAQTDVDNTKVNKRDTNASEVTADQQSNSKADVEMTRKIRSALTGDKSLSTYGHNVKIITEGGAIVLKGPVHSLEEKTSIETTAARVAGATPIKSQLEITGR